MGHAADGMEKLVRTVNEKRRKHAPLGRTITERRWRMRPRTREPMMRHEVPKTTGRRYFQAYERLITNEFDEDDIAINEGT